MTAKSRNLDLKLIDKYFLTANPIYDVIPLKVSYTFSQLGEGEMEDLEEFANVEEGKIERWLLVPDCISLGTLGYVVQRAFGLSPFAFTPSPLLKEEEQELLFPTLKSQLDACGSIFDNPFDLDYYSKLVDAACSSRIDVPHPQIAMMLESSFSYEEAQKNVWDEVGEKAQKGFVIDGKKYTLSDRVNLSSLNGVTKNKEYDWSDELCKHLELKDTLLREDARRPDLEKRFKGQRSTLTEGRKKGSPFTYELLIDSFFEDEPAFLFEVVRPSSVRSLIDDGYITLESYMESIQYVSKNFVPDCICKKGYDLFGDSEEAYHAFIMLLHSPFNEPVIYEARRGGWKEPTMDLKKIFRVKK